MSLKWDRRFLDLAQFISQWSKDPSTKVGTVITRPDNTIASIGYNGFPRNVSDSKELYSNREIKYQRMIHAEMNAILNAKEPLDNCTLYTSLAPCDRCAAHILQTRIRRVVFPVIPKELKERWGKSFDDAREILHEAGIVVHSYDGDDVVDETSVLRRYRPE